MIHIEEVYGIYRDGKIDPIKENYFLELTMDQLNYNLETIESFPFDDFGKYKESMEKIFPEEQDGKYGYVNLEGKLVIPYQFDSADYFREGLALVEENGLYGYIDKTGRKVISCQFEKAGHFYEGFAFVYRNGFYGYIDPTGMIVIPYQFESASNFCMGHALVKDGEFHRRIARPDMKALLRDRIKRLTEVLDGNERVFYYDLMNRRILRKEDLIKGVSITSNGNTIFDWDTSIMEQDESEKRMTLQFHPTDLTEERR